MFRIGRAMVRPMFPAKSGGVSIAGPPPPDRYEAGADSIKARTAWRSLTIHTHSCSISAVGGNRSGTMMVIIPARDAERTPLWVILKRHT